MAASAAGAGEGEGCACACVCACLCLFVSLSCSPTSLTLSPIARRMDVETAPLHCPPLEELASWMQDVLSKGFEEAKVEVVQCPDLKCVLCLGCSRLLVNDCSSSRVTADLTPGRSRTDPY